MEEERFLSETGELSGEHQIKKSNSILDVLGSWEPNKPLLDVKELRDQYRKKLIEDDFARQNCNRSDEL